MNLQQGYTTYARVYEMLCRLRCLSMLLLSMVQLKERFDLISKHDTLRTYFCDYLVV